jgi:hypothetical protein
MPRLAQAGGYPAIGLEQGGSCSLRGAFHVDHFHKTPTPLHVGGGNPGIDPRVWGFCLAYGGHR